MPNFKVKSCEVCSEEFMPTGPAARFCPACAKIKSREADDRYNASRRTGVGSGNHWKNKGVHHSCYKNGIGLYRKIRNIKAEEQDYKCNRCGKEFDLSRPATWVGHHIDHDRTNNTYDNIEVMCKSCHQKEHEVWKNFEGATTISSESTPKRVEAQDNLQG